MADQLILYLVLSDTCRDIAPLERRVVELDAERNMHTTASHRSPTSSKVIPSTETTVFDEELAPAQLTQFAIEATLQSSTSVTKRYDGQNRNPLFVCLLRY